MVHICEPRSEELQARMHTDDIIYGLRALDRATSGEIDKYIRDNIVKVLQEQIENDPWNKVENKENLDRLLESHKQSKRIIQKWLPKLEAKGLVTKDKYYVYSLTNKGKKLNIFPDVYGRMLLGTLINLPWHETKEKNIIEFIKRIGAFMLYVFISNLHTTSQSSTPVTAKLLDKKDLNWIKDAIPLDLIFFSFENIILRTMPRNQRQRLFIHDEGDYYKLLDILRDRFPKYYKVLKNADSVFLKKVTKPQSDD